MALRYMPPAAFACRQERLLQVSYSTGRFLLFFLLLPSSSLSFSLYEFIFLSAHFYQGFLHRLAFSFFFFYISSAR